MFRKLPPLMVAIAMFSGCSAATQYDSGAVVLDVSETGAFDTSGRTTPEFASASEAIEARQYARAEALLDQALAQKPRDPYALLAMGSVHEQTGRYYSAADFYRSAERYGTEATGPRLSGSGQPKAGTPATVSEVARENLTRLLN